jgi:hypothetical protein
MIVLYLTTAAVVREAARGVFQKVWGVWQGALRVICNRLSFCYFREHDLLSAEASAEWHVARVN